jgi:uncharacterized protein YdcH (DUF465 family)
LSGKKEERMAAIQRAPRDVIITADAEYQRLAEKHHQYEVELQNLARSPFLNSEDLLEEIRLKKLKLHVKDEMELLAARIHTSRAGQAQ